LEIADGGIGLGPEDAIDPTGVESERAETALQGRHIITAEHGAPVVEQPVPERQPGLHQRTPRLLAAHTIAADAPRQLERADRPFGARPEDRILIPGPVEAQRLQTFL